MILGAGVWLALTPFPLVEMLRFLGLFSLILAGGLGMISRGWSLRALPLAVMTGLAYVMVFGNLVAFVVSPPLSFGIVLAGLLLCALTGRRGRIPGVLEREGAGRGVIAAVVGCAVLLVVNNIVWLGHYHIDHLTEYFPDIATIAHGNIPFRDPFFPRQPGFYHYGPALVLAVFHSIALVPLEHLLGYLPFLVGIWCILLGTEMVHSRTGRVKAAALAFCGMAFAGALTWILFFFPAAFPAHAAFPNIFDAIAVKGQPAFALNPVTLGAQSYPFGFMLNSLNTVFGVGFSLAAAEHLELHLRAPGWRRAINIVTTLAALALSFETAFATMAAALAIYGLAVKGCRRQVLPLVLGAGILALFQGGVITDSMFHRDAVAPELHRFCLRWPPGFPAWGDATPSLAHPRQLLRFLVLDYGLTFWFLPLAALGALRARSASVSLLFLAAAGGLVFPALVRYPVADWDMSKFIVIAAFVLPVPYACGWLAVDRRRVLHGALMALLVLASADFGLRLARQGRWPAQPPPALTQGVDIQAGAWLRRNVEAGSVFLSDVPLLIVNQGFFALAAVRQHAQVQPFDHVRALERLDAVELRGLGVNYVYLTRDRCAGLAQKLQDAGRFEFVRDFDAQRFLFRVRQAPAG